LGLYANKEVEQLFSTFLLPKTMNAEIKKTKRIRNLKNIEIYLHFEKNCLDFFPPVYEISQT